MNENGNDFRVCDFGNVRNCRLDNERNLDIPSDCYGEVSARYFRCICYSYWRNPWDCFVVLGEKEMVFLHIFLGFVCGMIILNLLVLVHYQFFFKKKIYKAALIISRFSLRDQILALELLTHEGMSEHIKKEVKKMLFKINS